MAVDDQGVIGRDPALDRFVGSVIGSGDPVDHPHLEALAALELGLRLIVSSCPSC
jgi:hypothetical protein